MEDLVAETDRNSARAGARGCHLRAPPVTATYAIFSRLLADAICSSTRGRQRVELLRENRWTRISQGRAAAGRLKPMHSYTSAWSWPQWATLRQVSDARASRVGLRRSQCRQRRMRLCQGCFRDIYGLRLENPAPSLSGAES